MHTTVADPRALDKREGIVVRFSNVRDSQSIGYMPQRQRPCQLCSWSCGPQVPNRQTRSTPQPSHFASSAGRLRTEDEWENLVIDHSSSAGSPLSLTDPIVASSNCVLAFARARLTRTHGSGKEADAVHYRLPEPAPSHIFPPFPGGMIAKPIRGGSSFGRAPRSQRGGREFDPPLLHHPSPGQFP